MAHYSPTEGTDRRIVSTEIYLLDSGGQYYDGTTGEKPAILVHCFINL